MQFKVPQFLEIEDKIFGPFTFREFAYLAGGAGMCFVFYKLWGFILGAIPILLSAGFALLLTFYKPNGKPFIEMLQAGLKYGTQSKLYIWKRRKVKINTKQQNEKTPEPQNQINEGGTRLSGSRLRDLAWSLDVLDSKKQLEKEK